MNGRFGIVSKAISDESRLGGLVSKVLDKSKVEQAFERAGRTAVAGSRDARAGKFRVSTVYFVREGSGHGRTSEGRQVPLVEIVSAFPNTKCVWFEGAPTFYPELSVNHFSGYRFVVVHVQGGETGGPITKDGYWLLEGVSPTEFNQKLPRKRRAIALPKHKVRLIRARLANPTRIRSGVREHLRHRHLDTRRGQCQHAVVHDGGQDRAVGLAAVVDDGRAVGVDDEVVLHAG